VFLIGERRTNTRYHLRDPEGSIAFDEFVCRGNLSILEEAKVKLIYKVKKALRLRESSCTMQPPHFTGCLTIQKRID